MKKYFKIDKNSGIFVFDPNDKIPKQSLSPLVLFTLFPIKDPTINLSKLEMKENDFRNNCCKIFEKKDFFKNFTIKNDWNYTDSKMWRYQFPEGNQIYLLEDNKNYYLLHVSFLDSFHNDILEHAKNEKMSNSVNIYNFEKDVMIRNSSRFAFNFCAENKLVPLNDIYSASLDEKALKIKEEYSNPPTLIPTHFEFVNDVNIIDGKVYLLKNCSFENITTIGHIKLISEKRIHWINEKKSNLKKFSTYVYVSTTDGKLNNGLDVFHKSKEKTTPEILYDLNGKYVKELNMNSIYEKFNVLNTILLYK